MRNYKIDEVGINVLMEALIHYRKHLKELSGETVTENKTVEAIKSELLEKGMIEILVY